jgi:N-acetylglucosamine-6-phosphate deacetylase
MAKAWFFHGGTVLGPGGARADLAVAVEGSKVTAVGSEAERRRRRRSRQLVPVDLEGGYLTPGFVDLHTHGARGVDFFSAGKKELDAVISGHYLRHGVTRLLVSLYPEAWRRLIAATRRIAEAIGDGAGHGVAAGIHLEGPFLDPLHAGALPSRYFRNYSASALRELLEAGHGLVRTMTVAPERPRGSRLIAHLQRAGVVPAFGHSGADYRGARQAIDKGVRYVTHLFNAMEGIHHRRPGPVFAFLEDDRIDVELIADGHHVDAAILRWVADRKPPERLCLVSDSVSPCGLRPGPHSFAGRQVRLKGGRVTLADGTLAGSALTMDQAFRTQVRDVGLSAAEVAVAASYTPARIVGWHRQIGEVAVGKRADLVVLTPHLRIRQTFFGGDRVFSARK